MGWWKREDKGGAGAWIGMSPMNQVGLGATRRLNQRAGQTGAAQEDGAEGEHTGEISPKTGDKDGTPPQARQRSPESGQQAAGKDRTCPEVGKLVEPGAAAAQT